MDPIQNQPVGEIELTSPASGGAPPETETTTGEREFAEAGQAWIEKLTGGAPAAEETAAPPVVARPGQPGEHPQARLNERFRERLSRGQRLKQSEELNRKQQALIEKFSNLLGPLMEEGAPEEKGLPELLDPATADPIEFYKTVEERQLAALERMLDARLGPVMPFIETFQKSREQQQAERQQLVEAVQFMESEKETFQAMEEEYLQAPEATGYYERFGQYFQAQAAFLVDQGFHPDQARQIVHQKMRHIVEASQRLPRGPVHPIVYLDYVMQHEMPQLANVGRNGHSAAAPAPRVSTFDSRPSPAPPRTNGTAAELRAAANSGAAGTIGQGGGSAPSGSDLAPVLASGKMDRNRLVQLLKNRNGGKLPANLGAQLASLNAEIAALQKQG